MSKWVYILKINMYSLMQVSQLGTSSLWYYCLEAFREDAQCSFHSFLFNLILHVQVYMLPIVHQTKSRNLLTMSICVALAR